MYYIFNLERYKFYTKIQSYFWCRAEKKTSKKSVNSFWIICRTKNAVIHGNFISNSNSIILHYSVESLNTGIVKIYIVHAQNSEPENELYACRRQFGEHFKPFYRQLNFQHYCFKAGILISC